MPDGLFGFAKNASRIQSFGLANSVRQRPIGVVIDDVARRALNLGQRAIEQVARIREANHVRRADERPRHDRENVVAAVAAQNPIGIDAVQLAARIRNAVAIGSGYFCSPACTTRPIAAFTFGEHWYGFSFVFSLMNFSTPCGCSPGV